MRLPSKTQMKAYLSGVTNCTAHPIILVMYADARLGIKARDVLDGASRGNLPGDILIA